MDVQVLGRAALTFVILLLSLGFVTWRQSRAFEANQALDELRRQVSVAQAEQIELERDIQVRRSMTNIVGAAEAIGMVTPHAEDLVILGRGGGS
jgi:cell division protein FtsL